MCLFFVAWYNKKNQHTKMTDYTVLYLASWKTLEKIGFYQKISDSDIARVTTDHFIDTKENKWGLHDTTTTHTIRIASLANRIASGVPVDLVEMSFSGEMEDGEWYTMDGCHRIRAYVYLKKDMPCLMRKHPLNK